MDLQAIEASATASPLRWHIALTQPGQDLTAYQALRMRGYAVYRPVMPASQRRHGRLANMRPSMFPGYLFVLPAAQNRFGFIGPWESLRSAPGMIFGEHALLRLNGSLATIPHNDPVHGGIMQIRETEERLCNIKENGESERSWKIGDQVRAQKGPFIELLGIIETLDHNKRARIISNIFGRPTLVWVELAQLSPA